MSQCSQKYFSRCQSVLAAQKPSSPWTCAIKLGPHGEVSIAHLYMYGLFEVHALYAEYFSNYDAD